MPRKRPTPWEALKRLPWGERVARLPGNEEKYQELIETKK